MTLGTDNILLIDSSGYACYRAGATLSWWKRFRPEDKRSTEDLLQDEEFTSSLTKQYHSGLKKLHGEKIFARDCYIEKIWRKKHYDKYKYGRDKYYNRSHRPMGPIVKYLHKMVESANIGTVIKVEDAEADDIIAIYTRYISDVYPAKKIIIVTIDSDMKQLVSWGENISIFNPKLKTFFSDQREADRILENKIVKGDATDKVPAMSTIHNVDDPLYSRIHNSILVDLSYIPRYIRDRAIKALKLNNNLKKPETYSNKHIQLGLCCMHTYLRKKNIFCSRTLRLQTIEQKGLDILLEKCLQNCNDLLTMIDWCYKTPTKDGPEVPVRVLRLSSDMLPHLCNPKLIVNYDGDVYDKVMSTVDPLLKQVGSIVRKKGIRLTFHPGQYNVVGTPHEDKFVNTIGDLKWHAEVLDRIGCDNDSVMVVHGGGVYGDKPKTMHRWVTNYERLPMSVKRRLVLENCEKCFNIEDCLWISERTGVPVVFDTHHFTCYNQLHPRESLKDADHYIPLILETWKKRNIKPKFHISEQRCGSNVGAHSDYIETIPKYLFDIYTKYQVDIDIMIEAKCKDLAIKKLYEKYKSIDPMDLIPEKPIKKIKAWLKHQSSA